MMMGDGVNGFNGVDGGIEGFLEEGGELVKEGTYVGTLVVEAIEREDGKEVFCQFIEWHSTEFFEVMDVGFRQETVVGFFVEQELFIAHLVI